MARVKMENLYYLDNSTMKSIFVFSWLFFQFSNICWAASEHDLIAAAVRIAGQTQHAIKENQAALSKKDYSAAKNFTKNLREARDFYDNAFHGKYGLDFAENYAGDPPDTDEFYVNILSPYVFSNDVPGYLRFEEEFKSFDGYAYWGAFPQSYAEGTPRDDNGRPIYKHAYDVLELKRLAFVSARRFGSSREASKSESFWRSKDFPLGLEEWELKELDRESSGINVSSWFYCNRSLFLDDPKGSLYSCAQYAQFDNYYDPKRYRNREYALALLFAGQSDKAEQQFALYKAASDEKQTLMQLADPAVYPAARKLHKLPELASCAARNYGQEHLRDHPKQRVTGIRLAKQKEGVVTLGIQLRDTPTWQESTLTCQGKESQQCQLACNGGSITVARKGDRTQLTNQGFNLKACSSQSLLIDPAQDQQVFLLDNAAPARCYAF